MSKPYNYKAIFNDPYNELEDIEPSDTMKSKFWYHGMYVVVEQSWVSELADWVKGLKAKGLINGCYEVMAGRGWLAKALESNGVVVSASDNESDDSRKVLDLELTTLVYPVSKLEADQIADKITRLVSKNPSNRYLVIMCYPNDKTDAAYDFVRRLPSGTLVVYIGDGEFQYTANEKFEQAVTWLHQNQTHSLYSLYTNFPGEDNVINGFKYGSTDYLECVIWLGVV